VRVVPIPDVIRNAEWVAGTRVYASPTGDLTDPVVPPAEGILYNSHPTGSPEGTVWPTVGVVVRLDEDDVEKITAGARHLLLAWPGHAMPVFMVPEVLTEPGLDP
jgi:hypothetical protein